MGNLAEMKVRVKESKRVRKDRGGREGGRERGQMDEVTIHVPLED